VTNEEMDVKVLESIRSGKTRVSAVMAHMKLGMREVRTPGSSPTSASTSQPRRIVDEEFSRSSLLILRAEHQGP
jgi:hypothetical protein